MINEFVNENEFLSNFYPSPIKDEKGIEYPTVEHYFQAAKTLDESERKAIAAAPTPGKAKQMGRNVNLRRDWEVIKEYIMYDALRLKFADPVLAEKLLATGDQDLEEGNWWHDNTWGNCKCDKCKDIPGKNLLGQLLMRVRSEIQ